MPDDDLTRARGRRREDHEALEQLAALWAAHQQRLWAARVIASLINRSSVLVGIAGTLIAVLTKTGVLG